MPYVNIKITREGHVTAAQKKALIAGVTQLIGDVLHKNTKSLVVTIDEVDMDNWGIGGVPVTEIRKAAAKAAKEAEKARKEAEKAAAKAEKEAARAKSKAKKKAAKEEKQKK
ncbi:MAG: 4-oxalocrotonate tautomerase family protein [Succiniclasticum sp.]|nr:4-oxalocrotonate tautomerase family protein [Succiniclasticum sp.]MEE3478848.1 4-oxalocrotonate tautomerase family protein [Succiniclasticum sp.]